MGAVLEKLAVVARTLTNRKKSFPLGDEIVRLLIVPSPEMVL